VVSIDKYRRLASTAVQILDNFVATVLRSVEAR
jgi:hypothetical protein